MKRIRKPSGLEILLVTIMVAILGIVGYGFFRQQAPEPTTQDQAAVTEKSREWNPASTSLNLQSEEEGDASKADIQAPVTESVATEPANAPVQTPDDPLAGMTRGERIEYVRSLPEYQESHKQYFALEKKERELYEIAKEVEKLQMEAWHKAENVKPLTAKDLEALESMLELGVISEADYQKYQRIYEQREGTRDLYELYTQQEKSLMRKRAEIAQQSSEISKIQDELSLKKREIVRNHGLTAEEINQYIRQKRNR